MKIIPLDEADTYIVAPIQESKPLEFVELPFPNLRASNFVMVFSEEFVKVMTDWWLKWMFETGFDYRAGSSMCESGVKILVGKIHQAVFPWRGEGDVDEKTLARAKEEGHEVPTQRFGDFNPGVYDLRCLIPKGVAINGVTDGGHSTALIFVHNKAGECWVLCWEWQNGSWARYDTALKNGVEVVDIID